MPLFQGTPQVIPPLQPASAFNRFMLTSTSHPPHGTIKNNGIAYATDIHLFEYRENSINSYAFAIKQADTTVNAITLFII
jgi:hypothetical protein